MNHLNRIDEFAAVLADYHLSATASELLDQMQLVLLVGPSSSGRNTIINKLVAGGGYHYIVSDTTRKPRSNNGIPEENGREYWFRTEQEVLNDLRNGQFLEAAIIHQQQVSGISMRELQTAADKHAIAMSEIEIVGADNLYNIKSDALFLFIVPPSFDEWMVRMQTRGALPDDELRRRLQSAVTEFETALERDYYQFVVNDTFAHAANRINGICQGHQPLSDEEQAAGRRTAQEVLDETKAFLAENSWFKQQ